MEAASLPSKDVDFKEKTFILHNTKNRENHTLPMSDFLYDLFWRRHQFKINEYVFPASSKNGSILFRPRSDLKVGKLLIMTSTFHDL